MGPDADVSEGTSAYIVGVSEKGRKVPKLKTQEINMINGRMLARRSL
jgi:hypothetical protein